MAKARIVGRLDASQNLSTSPFTVDIKGDTFDYTFMAFCDSGTTTNGALNINLNADTGANYDDSVMRGRATTASAGAATSQTAMVLGQMTRNQSSRNGFAMGLLTGESGNERKMAVNFSAGYNPDISVKDHYWTNTADEATSITFTGTVSASYTWHIVVWEVPRTNRDGWEYVNKLDWSSETDEKSFTTDGDTDIQYMLDWDVDQLGTLQLNNDGGANYTRQRLINSSGSLSATNNTGLTGAGNLAEQSRNIINAESGVDRLIYSSNSQTSANQQEQNAFWWQNTGSNLTSLDCTPSASATGTAKLYRKKLKPSMQTDLYNLPFRTIEEYDVSGDFSAGYTFSGLNGDDYLMLKVEVLITGASTDIYMRINADTGSNYTYQRVRGNNSTASALNSTGSSLFLTDSNTVGYCTVYIYPKSGEYRPILYTSMRNDNVIGFYGAWWLNSADEISSLLPYANNTNSMTGKIRVSAIYKQGIDLVLAQTLLLNGSSQYLNIGQDASLTLGDGDKSHSIWFATSSGSANQMFNQGDNSSGPYYDIYIESGLIVARAWDGTNTRSYRTTGTFNDGNLHNLVVKWNSYGAYEIYVDGVSEAVTAINTDTVTSVGNASKDLTIGIRLSTTSQYFNGSLALPYMFDKTVTSDDIAEIYNSGTPTQPWLLSQSLKNDADLLLPLNDQTDSNEYSDYSGNANDATAVGSPTITGEDLTIISGPDPSP